ncbi:hypothetical protein C0Q70_14638 [Pomacea canaliculata]|uniref:Uncharacterized protein n=1 Tax=Pomacea canaliculata TaxID=400727 RepID=A0A2T7NSN5_POMCA|nr:hypothetical protein C0Q70_14638 [Pomacea canaliculata]
MFENGETGSTLPNGALRPHQHGDVQTTAPQQAASEGASISADLPGLLTSHNVTTIMTNSIQRPHDPQACSNLEVTGLHFNGNKRVRARRPLAKTLSDMPNCSCISVLYKSLTDGAAP